MTFASRTQFHVERPWGQRPFSPSRGLLRDCTTSLINRFAALTDTRRLGGGTEQQRAAARDYTEITETTGTEAVLNKNV